MASKIKLIGSSQGAINTSGGRASGPQAPVERLGCESIGCLRGEDICSLEWDWLLQQTRTRRVGQREPQHLFVGRAGRGRGLRWDHGSERLLYQVLSVSARALWPGGLSR